MGTTCLTVCSGCNRHLRCGERSCPFCGARVASFLRVLEYRLKTRLGRGQAFSLGAALTAAGFVTSCEESTVAPPYGLACTPVTCSTGTGGTGGTGGATLGGSAGRDPAANGGTTRGGADEGGQATGAGGAEDGGGAGGAEDGGSAGR